MEKVECEGIMEDEAVLEMQGEVRFAANEAGDKVILVDLDGTFDGVGAMKVRRNELEIDSGIAQKLFQAAGAFIVEHLVLGGEAVLRKGRSVGRKWLG